MQAANWKLWQGQNPGKGTASIRRLSEDPAASAQGRQLKGSSAEEFEASASLMYRLVRGV